MKFPGVAFNYTQPAEDAVDEAETGLKSSLAVKIFGSDLHVLEKKAEEIEAVLNHVSGINRVTLVHELGQPSLTVQINRAKIAQYGINAGDVNTLISSAVGGVAATEVVQGEQQFDLVVRLQPQFRESPEAIGAILMATPGGHQVPLRELATIQVASGASYIYRENNSRYIGVQFAVEGRDLAGAVQDAQRQVAAAVKLPIGYRADWGGEYEEYTASRGQLAFVLPLTIVLIFVLLFALYRNFTFPLITVIGVVLSAPVGGLIALAITGDGAVGLVGNWIPGPLSASRCRLAVVYISLCQRTPAAAE